MNNVPNEIKLIIILHHSTKLCKLNPIILLKANLAPTCITKCIAEYSSVTEYQWIIYQKSRLIILSFSDNSHVIFMLNLHKL